MLARDRYDGGPFKLCKLDTTDACGNALAERGGLLCLRHRFGLTPEFHGIRAAAAGLNYPVAFQP